MKILFIILVICASTFNPLAGQSEEPFTYVENMPSFPGGQQKMYEYIASSIQYPEAAWQNKISGQVIVQFVVEKDGTLNRIKTVRGIEGLNEEAIRVVESMNDGYKWTPGTHNGRTVPVTFTLPIKFVLKS